MQPRFAARHRDSGPEIQTWPECPGSMKDLPLLPELLCGKVLIHGQKTRSNSPCFRCQQCTLVPLNHFFHTDLTKTGTSGLAFLLQLQLLIAELGLITNSAYFSPTLLRRTKVATVKWKPSPQRIMLGGESPHTALERVLASSLCAKFVTGATYD